MHGEIVILGSGTSMGVPTLGCTCRVCTSTDPRDRRLRPSIAVEWFDAEAADAGGAPPTTRSGEVAPKPRRVVIDTGPDFREQALREKIRHLDAVFYTHSHADHILGLDDLRPLTFLDKERKLPLYADDSTARILERIFDYTFSPDSPYPTRARVELHRLPASAAVAGVDFQRIPLRHGELDVAGFRFGNAAYLTDMNHIPDEGLTLLEGVEVVVLDALRKQPHPSHANVEQATEWVRRLRAREGWFTHMSHDISHAEVEQELAALPGPERIHLAYDGLRIPVEL